MQTDIDPLAVLAALGVPPAAPPLPVRGGWDTALWRFQTADGAWHALRVFRRPEQAGVARREQAALAAAAAGGVPVPAVEAHGSWNGLPAVVLEWAPGAPLFSVLQHRPWRLWRLGVTFGRVQALVHAVPSPPDLREGAPWYWLRKPGPDGQAVTEAVLAVKPAASVLVHLDYHPLNVLADGRRVTAVLDWANAGAGDPRADAARTAVLLQAAPIPAGPLRPVLTVARWVLYHAWRRGYQQAAGPLPDLTPFMAWAGSVFLSEMEARLGQPQVWATGRDVEAVRRRVAPYRGPLGGAEPWAWVEPLRQQLHGRVVAGLLRGVAAARVGGDPAAAAELALALLAVDPACEEACREAMRAAAALGDHHGVRKAYELCADGLERLAGAAPSQETVRLHQALHPSGPAGEGAG